MRRSAVLFAVVALGGFAVACASDPSGAKTAPVICEDEGKACPEQKTGKPAKAGPTTSELPVTPVSPDAPKKKADAPADGGTDGAPLWPADPDPDDVPDPDPVPTAPGPECTSLKPCCQNLSDAELLSMATDCNATVALKGEFSCANAHLKYKAADFLYDPVCF